MSMVPDSKASARDEGSMIGLKVICCQSLHQPMPLVTLAAITVIRCTSCKFMFDFLPLW